MISLEYFIAQIESNGKIIVSDKYGHKHLFLSVPFETSRIDAIFYPLYSIYLGKGTFIENENDAEYSGFIFENRIYDCGYELMKFIESGQTYEKTEDLLAQIKSMVITNLEHLYPDFESYVTYLEKQQISVAIDEDCVSRSLMRRLFMTGETITHKFGKIGSSHYIIPRYEIMNYLINPTGTIERITLKYVEDNKTEIYKSYRDYHNIEHEVAIIESDSKHSWHSTRNIIKCITSERFVNIELKKDDISFVGKMNAANIRRGLVNDDDILNVYFDAKSRKQFKELFGSHAYINSNDIVRITYGRKTLYEKT